MSSLAPTLRQRFFDQNGEPLVAGLLYTYVAGSAIPLATYTDETELTPNTNPIVLDSNGECDLWLGTTAYKFILKDSLGVTQWTVDSVLPATSGGGGGGGGMTSLNGDIVAIGTGSVTATIQAGVVDNSKMADMPDLTLKGNISGSASAPFDLTASEATTLLNAMVGDSGAGGMKGLAPAPLAGDAASGKFLKADGTWQSPPPGGITSLTTDVVASGSGAAAATIQAGVVSNSKLANIPAQRIKGNNTLSSAAPLDLTPAQINAMLPVVTDTLNGLAPLSGGGTTNFLRADGTWTVPAGGVGTISSLTTDVVASGTGAVAATIQSGVVSNSKLATMPATTIKGNNTVSTAAPLDLTPAQLNAMLPVVTSALNGLAPASGGGTTNFLRADGTWAAAGTAGAITSLTTDVVTSGSGAATATIQAGVVTNSKLATMPTLTLKGNKTGGTASPSDLTVAEVNTILPVVTSTLNGLAPLSGGGTANFLRADGTWAPTGLNYISNYDASTNTTGWNTYADAAAAPVDGTGGTPTATFTRSTTSPLRGSGSFIYTPGALGNGVSGDFTIDSADTASMLTIEFDYSIGGTGYADGLLQAWVYDVTNATLTQPTPYTILNQTVPGKFKAQFQTNSNSTSYRLIIHQSTATSTYTVKLDNVKVGPSTYAVGPAMSDWTAYTPTFTGFGTVSAVDVQWSRVGSDLLIQGSFTSGTSTATEGRISLPLGLTSSSALPTLQLCGDLARASTFGESAAMYTGIEASKTYIVFTASRGTIWQPLTKLNADSFGSGVINFSARVKIQGWSTNTTTSSDSSTRVVAFRSAGTPTGTMSSTFANITWPAASTDTHSAFNGTTTYTIPVSGVYDFDIQVVINATFSLNNVAQVQILKNGSTIAKDNAIAGGAVTFLQTNTRALSVQCNAGDTITTQARATGTSPSLDSSSGISWFTAKRTSGPAQVQASETVACEYNTASGGSVANSTITYIDFGAKESDATSSVFGAGSGNVTTTNTGWRFIAPMSGRYQVNAVIGVLTANSTAGDIVTMIYVNNAQIQQGTRNQIATSSTGSLIQSQVSGVVRLLTGDRIEIAFLQTSGATRNLTAGASSNRVSICRVGNY